MTHPRFCDCGAPATSHRNLCGLLLWRCADCTRAAEALSRADVAAAVAGGATWLGAGEGVAAKKAVMNWHLSHRADPRAAAIADRHYNRQKIGSSQFVPPGRCLVLLTAQADALWVTSWPFAEYVRHAWGGAWVCSIFRNEGSLLSSELIRQAVAATRWYWSDVPPLGMITFVNAAKVRSSNPGYCFQRAGFRKAGTTKGGLVALQLLPSAMPVPEQPIGTQLRMAI